MDVSGLNQPLLAAVNKHHIAGIVGIVIGAVLVGFGALRLMTKAAGAAIVPLLGAAILIVGILVFTHVI